jgi:hypothetical protein
MKDKILLTKIKDYLVRVENNYNKIRDLKEVELLQLDEAYSLTQFITNIHSLVLNLSNEEVADKMLQVTGRGLITCRNISAHDYDSLDWDRVKALCKRLLSEKSVRILEDCFKLVEKDESGQKDYSKSTVFNKPK